MNHHHQKPPLSWGLISIFIIATAVLFILGILFINSQKNHILNEKENELAAVANLKVGQISRWRHEKMGDANLIHDNLSLTGQIFDFLNQSDSVNQRKEFSEQLLLARLMIIFFVFAFGAIIGWVIWHQRVRYYRAKYEAELDRLAVRKHFDFAEGTLKESEEKFRKIFEESPVAILMSDNSFKIIRMNPSFCKLLGYEENEIIDLTFRDFTHPDHIKNDEMSLIELTEGKIPNYRTEKRYLRKNGSVIWGSTTISVIRDSQDQVQYFLAMVEDITMRKESEFQIEESNSLLRATLESTADGILVVDLNGKIVQFNRKFAEMWKIPETILDSRDDEKALSFVRNQLKEPDSFLTNVKHLYENPDSVSFDRLEFCDGRVFERYSQPQKVSNETVGRVWSFRDITQRKIAEDQLIKAKDKAEESDRLKTAFLNNISHEIRTPMNAIVGFTTLLDDPDLQAGNRKQYIDIIYQSSNQLLSIITDIVDISNIETGQTKVTLNQININSEIRNLYEQYRPEGSTAGSFNPLQTSSE